MEEKNHIGRLDIITIGNDTLRQKAKDIIHIDDKIRRIAEGMVQVMHAAPGIGLAAPQVNHSIRLITVDLSAGRNSDDLMILLNPEITHREGRDLMEEGCLSVPGINEKLIRPYEVVCRGTDLKGREKTIEAEGLLARVLCHEIDHLNGILFIDHLSPLKKKLIKKKITPVHKS
ncbi:MAG: peptide deformylase [Candidatus Aminicenantaceae bacterium]